MSGKNVLMTGTTGMIGKIVLELCLERDDVAQVTSIGRTGCGRIHEKLFEIVYSDHLDYPAIARSLEGQDVALFCLADYKGIVSDEELEQITSEYVQTFVEALYNQSPHARISLLSVKGADAGENSRNAFARYKGFAEKALKEKNFARVDIFRPAYIYPVTPRDEPTNVYRLIRFIYPIMRLVYPNMGVSSEQLAKVMVETAMKETLGRRIRVFENREIREYL